MHAIISDRMPSPDECKLLPVLYEGMRCYVVTPKANPQAEFLLIPCSEHQRVLDKIFYTNVVPLLGDEERKDADSK